MTDRCDKKALSGLPGFFGGYPRCVLTPAELDILENGLNINCSDLDLCEFEGKTRIYYANGDQMTYSFLCEAEYDGGLDEFLAAFFKWLCHNKWLIFNEK